MQFSLNTINLFKNSAPKQAGSINLLFSGTLDPLSVGANFSANPPTWITSSWDWDGVSVGQLISGSIKGITVTNYDLNGADNTNLFKSCTELSFLLDKGDGISSTVSVPVRSKEYFSTYTFFDVDVSVDSLKCQVYFYRDSNDNFLGYSCTAFDGNPLVISVFPSLTEYASEDLSSLDPLLNNAVDSRLNTVTQKVEVFKTGSGSERGSGIILYDKCTLLADVQDLFYSSYANVSGRFVGSKQSFVQWFTSSKEQYSQDNLNVISENITETFRTTSAVEIIDLTTQSLSGNLSGSLQFVNRCYTGSLGSGSNYLSVDAGVSMSIDDSAVGRAPLISFYGTLTTESIIGPDGVNTYGQITVPRITGYFSSESYMNMYVRGIISGSITGLGIGTLSGSTYYCEPELSTRGNPKCTTQQYENESVDLSYVSGSLISGSFKGILTGYFKGLMNLTECSGTLSTDAFSGSLLGHVSGSISSSAVEIYSIKGGISGSIDISPSGSVSIGGDRALVPTTELSPQFVTVVTTVLSDKIANLPVEMPFYNVIPLDSCNIFSENSQISYTDDVQDLINNGASSRETVSFMVGTTYVSQSISPSEVREYLTTERIVGLKPGQREYPKIGDIAYLSNSRLGPKKIYLAENTTCYTTDYNGQITEAIELTKRPNTVIVAEGTLPTSSISQGSSET